MGPLVQKSIRWRVGRDIVNRRPRKVLQEMFLANWVSGKLGLSSLRTPVPRSTTADKQIWVFFRRGFGHPSPDRIKPRKNG